MGYFLLHHLVTPHKAITFIMKPWVKAVSSFMNKELLLNMKHGRENAGDISEGGWFDEWATINTKLQEDLRHFGISDFDQYRIYKELNCENFFCDPDEYEDPEKFKNKRLKKFGYMDSKNEVVKYCFGKPLSQKTLT